MLPSGAAGVPSAQVGAPSVKKEQQRRVRGMASAALGGALAVALLVAAVVSKQPSTMQADELVALNPGQMEAVQVQVPRGAKAGQVLKVVVPGRRSMLFAKIPVGLSPGAKFQVLASPPAQARLEDPAADPAAAAPPAEEPAGAAPEAPAYPEQPPEGEAADPTVVVAPPPLPEEEG
eukprot:CAMPEP_0173426246 /NCGR_PEP_ID=MMETSP1357-20121228/5772_1 /TAXON_ID=77926 /ORGANISM="Hemiselmis rufescens, Strain PCC563" /LENGTH=176 /DNA_ID=CAMNT_0014389873 /DNA_START=16 /DNA_END=543 /DNA_ORIENTATION=-